MDRSYTLQEISDLVRRTAPTLYLHDEERYMPSSVEWYLERVTQVSRSGERVALGGDGRPPQDRLVTYPGPWPFTGDVADYWLEAPDSALGGDHATARSYVSIRKVEPGFLDISHWFWYPGNGCGTARVRTLAFDTTVITNEAIALTTLGFHVSDWEKVTVRVADDAQNTLHSVYFAQHGDGHWYTPDQLDREPSGGFAVYASKNGHASYPRTGPHYSYHIKTAPPEPWSKLTPSALEIWLRNDAMRGGRKVDCSASHEIVSIHDAIPLLADDRDAQADYRGVPYFGRVMKMAGQPPVVTEPRWLQYPYRWGQETEQKITHEVVFEALKMAIGPLAVYGALTFGAMLPLLGAIAGLLAPFYVKMENEVGKPGLKSRFTRPGPIDLESPSEPENYFTEAVDSGLAGMVDWVAAAGRDVAGWTTGAADSVADWTTGAAGDVASWTENAAVDTGAWFAGAAGTVSDWSTSAANDVAGWTTQAANDAADWATGAASDTASWAEGAARDTASALDPRSW